MPAVSEAPQEFGHGRVWVTQSTSRPGLIHVTLLTDDNKWHCTCEGWRHRYKCRHVNELKEVVGEGDDSDFHLSF